MRFDRSKYSKCSLCPLRDQARVWGEGNDGVPTGIVFIGEAPGREEDEQRKPFVGDAGRYLNGGLARSGVPRFNSWVTNTICCRPPGNDISCSEALEALVFCRPGLEAELEHLRGSTKVVCCLGATPSHQLLGDVGKIGNIRGSVYVKDDIPVVTTYHPSYLMRMTYNRGEEKVDLLAVWQEDLAKVKRISEEGWHPPKELFNIEPTLGEIEAYVKARVDGHDLIAVDIETSGDEIVVVGLAHNGEEAISVPLLTQGGKRYWSEGDEIIARNQVQALFYSNGLMFQNALFDVPFLRRNGYVIPYENIKHDTLLLHHAIHPELPHNLAFIVSTYGNTPYWKGTLRERKGSILDLPDEELRRYNLRDAVVLHQVLRPLQEDLKEVGTEDVYLKEALPMLKPVMMMQENGILLDEKRLEKCVEGWKAEGAQLEAQLRELGGLPTAFNLDSGDDLRWFLFEIEPNKFKRIAELPGKRVGTKIRATLEGLAEIQKVKPLYLPAYRGRRTETGKLTIDDQGLLSLRVFCQNRLEYVRGLKKDHSDEEASINRLLKWLALFSDYRKVTKLQTTYSRFPVDPQGRVHTHFLIHGTATRRLSSSEPNLQNIPKKAVEVRKCFVAPKGSVLISGDYSNLEVRVLAYVSGDAALRKVVESGANVHDENTRVLFGIDEKHPQWGLARRAAKIFMFGGISYGGGDREVYEKVVLEAPELNLTFARYVEAKARWMDAHPGYQLWAAKIREEVVRTRQLKDPFGRVRIFMGREADIQKEGLNFPIQAGASGIINQAMVRIADRVEEMKSLLVLQVHDQLLFEVPLEELDSMKLLVKEEMERPIEFNHCGRISFPIDLQVGPSWGDLE